MGRPPLSVDIAPKHQKELAKLLSGGVQQVRVVLLALALLQLAKGASAPQMAKVVPLTAEAVRNIGRRYQQGGLERALYERPRPGAAEVLDDSQKQRLIAMLCSNPPEGAPGSERSCQTQIGSPRRKRNHPNSPAQPRSQAVAGKMWVVADLDEDYIAKMEDVLEVYERPYDQQEPVVCLDEKPITLHADVRPRHRLRQDGKRAGMTNMNAAGPPMFSVP